MNIRVKLYGNGKLEKAIKRIEAAKKELDAAGMQLEAACFELGIGFEEVVDTGAASIASTDGLDRKEQ